MTLLFMNIYINFIFIIHSGSISFSLASEKTFSTHNQNIVFNVQIPHTKNNLETLVSLKIYSSTDLLTLHKYPSLFLFKAYIERSEENYMEMFSDTLTMQDVKDVFENGSEDEENENDENQKESFSETLIVQDILEIFEDDSKDVESEHDENYSGHYMPEVNDTGRHFLAKLVENNLPDNNDEGRKAF